jgi:hypothetical protein
MLTFYKFRRRFLLFWDEGREGRRGGIGGGGGGIVLTNPCFNRITFGESDPLSLAAIRLEIYSALFPEKLFPTQISIKQNNILI